MEEISDDCLSYGNVVDDDHSGIDRALHASTEIACGRSACTCVLTFGGLGPDRKPVLVQDQGVCLYDM